METAIPVDDSPLSAQFENKDTYAPSVRPNRIYATYLLTLLFFTYAINQLDKFSLSIVAKPVAQELQYGNQECMVNDEVQEKFTAKYHLSQNQLNRWSSLCSKSANESFCSSANITFNLQQLGNMTAYHPCIYNYDGTGFQYQLVAGPVFDNIYAVSAIFMGLLADFHHLKTFLFINLIIWSVLTGITGFVEEYWQLVLARFGVAIGSAGCTPFAACIIVNYFSKEFHGVVLGIYNWGVYIGYGAAFAIGNQVAKRLSWHWVFYLTGGFGVIIAPFILLTISEPKRQVNEIQKKRQLASHLSFKERTLLLLLTFFPERLLCGYKPMAAYPSKVSYGLWLVIVAGGVRNAGGYVWAYNAQLFYTNEKGLNVDQITEYMSWIPAVGGIIGAFLGGLAADLVAKYGQPHHRLWVLVVSQVIAAPFAAGALFLPSPWCFLILLPAFVFGEMWIGVTIAVVVDIVPAIIQASVIAVFLFIITVIGGNFNVLLSVLVQAGLDRRWALLITFPGLYILGSFLFFIAYFVLCYELSKARNNLYVSLVDTTDEQ